jgi:hypothetical protein
LEDRDGGALSVYYCGRVCQWKWECIDVSIDSKTGGKASRGSKGRAKVKVEAFLGWGFSPPLLIIFSYPSSIWRSLIGGG